jgi:hypothetical protein
MNAKTLFGISLLVVATTTFSQSIKSIQQAEKKAVERIQQATDSINGLANDQRESALRNHKAKLDSLYIAQFERASGVTAGKLDFNGWLVTILSFLVTVLAVGLGINWFATAARHKKELEQQTQKYDQSIKDQSTLFTKYFEEQKSSFIETVKKQNDEFVQVKTNFESVMRNLEMRIEEKVKEVEKSGKSGTVELEALKKDLNELKELRTNSISPSHNSKVYESWMKHAFPISRDDVKCSECGKPINFGSSYAAICPACRALNVRF